MKQLSIGNIKRRWLRRTVLIVLFVPLTLAMMVLMSLLAICEAFQRATPTWNRP